MTSSSNIAQQIKERPTRTAMVSLTDLWALQKAIKYNTFLYDGRNGQPIFPSTVLNYPSGPVHVHTAWKLRSKVNSLILRFVQEEITDSLLALPLDYDEAWYIDSVFSVASYEAARLLLVQVMQCIWEHEMNLPLKTDTINKETGGADGQFDSRDLIEYVSQQNEKGKEGWTLPEVEEEPARICFSCAVGEGNEHTTRCELSGIVEAGNGIKGIEGGSGLTAV